MQLIEDIRKRLENRNISEVARRAGMARGTVHHLADGSKTHIYCSTWVTLSAVLDVMDNESK